MPPTPHPSIDIVADDDVGVGVEETENDEALARALQEHYNINAAAAAAAGGGGDRSNNNNNNNSSRSRRSHRASSNNNRRPKEKASNSATTASEDPRETSETENRRNKKDAGSSGSGSNKNKKSDPRPSTSDDEALARRIAKREEEALKRRQERTKERSRQRARQHSRERAPRRQPSREPSRERSRQPSREASRERPRQERAVIEIPSAVAGDESERKKKKKKKKAKSQIETDEELARKLQRYEERKQNRRQAANDDPPPDPSGQVMKQGSFRNRNRSATPERNRDRSVPPRPPIDRSNSHRSGIGRDENQETRRSATAGVPSRQNSSSDLLRASNHSVGSHPSRAAGGTSRSRSRQRGGDPDGVRASPKGHTRTRRAKSRRRNESSPARTPQPRMRSKSPARRKHSFGAAAAADSDRSASSPLLPRQSSAGRVSNRNAPEPRRDMTPTKRRRKKRVGNDVPIVMLDESGKSSRSGSSRRQTKSPGRPRVLTTITHQDVPSSRSLGVASQSSQPKRKPKSKPSSKKKKKSRNTTAMGPSAIELDRELARKLQQQDREAMQSMQVSQNSRESRGSGRTGRRISVYQVELLPTPQKKWTARRCLSLAIPLVVILAAVVGLAFAFSGSDSLPNLPAPPIFDNGEDPFQGINPDEANRWNNRNPGLTLEVLNALEDDWEILFELAIDDWDSGEPDALTLITSKVAVDNACEPVEGKLKVCNGDYGETKWRGINQVLLSNGFIISSVAKLNEFYLANSDRSQRRYTMCHEIGHGFGLPHTDENFYNADLGNCMDYTANPEANKSPDETNFAFLQDLYGSIRRRSLRAMESDLKDLPKFSPDLLFRYDEAVSESFLGGEQHYAVKTLHKSDHFEERAIELGEGFQLRLHMLLAEP